ncbi:MAG: hypothetical protein KDC45_10260 [Bacteroidetes bacterium]|nr:hypothetical protein [Bacteroidota bacterium]
MATPYINLTGIDYSDPEKKYHELQADPAAHAESAYDRYADSANRMTSEPAAARKSVITPLKLYVAFMVFAVLMMVWVWEATVVQENLTRIEQLKDLKLELEKSNEAIRVDITRLSAYERIEKIAREQIGLQTAAQKPGVIWVDPELLKRAAEAAANRKHE